MAKKKFKPGGTSVGFKSIGQGLKQSQYEIQKRAEQDINALKLAKQQHRENTNINISGLADKAGFEENVQKEKHRLERAVRERQQEALSIKAVRDVERLRGEAKEQQKRAEYWKDLTPKMARAASQLATGIWNISEGMEAQAMSEAFRKSNNASLVDFYHNEERRKLYLKWIKDNNKVDTLEEQIAYSQSVPGRDNTGYANSIFQQGEENRQFYENEISTLIQAVDEKEKEKDPKNASNRPGLDKDNVLKWYTHAAYLHLQRHGIDPNSSGGRKIIAQWERWGTNKRQEFVNDDNFAKTDKQIAASLERIHAESSNPDKTVRNSHVNDLAKTLSVGTFKDKYDRYSGPITNPGEQVQYILEQYTLRYGTRFKTAKQVREFIESFPQLGDEGKGENALGFCTRHKKRCDDIVDNWSIANNRKQTERSDKVKAENNELIAAFNKREQEHQDNKENNSEYKVTDAEFYAKEVDLTFSYKTGDANAKNHVYRQSPIVTGSFDQARNWFRVQTLINDGKHDQAGRVFASLSNSEREKLRPMFEAFQGLEGYTDGSNTTGFGLVKKKVFNVFKKVEKGGALSSSGEILANTMMERVMAKYLSFVKSDKDGDKIAFIEQALKEEEELWIAGVDTKNPRKFPDTPNPYNRKWRDWLHPLLGETPQYVYQNGEDSGDDSLIADLENAKVDSADGTLSNAPQSLKNLVIHTASPKELEARLGAGIYSYESALASGTIISPHEVLALRTVARNNAEGRSFFEGNASYVVPKNVKVLARYTKNKSEVDVINDLLDFYGYPERYQADGQVQQQIQSGTNKLPPISFYGRYGESLANSAFAQGVDPMPNDIFTYRNMFIRETGRQFTTEDGDIIDLPDDGFPSAGSFHLDPKLEAFIQSNELEVDIGANTISDPEKFFNEGGANYLNFDQAMSLFGLQGLTPIEEK